jgi:Uma2 family endonuclease
MATVQQRQRGQQLLLSNVDWETYSRLLRVFAERPSLRLTYDHGALEIMSPLLEHDNDARFLHDLVVVLCEELNFPRKCGGSTTFRRRRRRRGLEPDDCFWIANEARVRGLRRIDLRRHPPPDLTIEVDLTRSSLDRMAIYAALGVPEVWRIDSQGLSFHGLQGGTYAPLSHSLSFPLVTPADLTGFLQLRAQTDETSLVIQFRAWVRQRIAGSSIPPVAP